MSTSHIYPGAASLSTYITIKRCAEVIEFYKKAFNAKELGVLKMPNGLIGHAEIEIEGSMLMMGDENIDWGQRATDYWR